MRKLFLLIAILFLFQYGYSQTPLFTATNTWGDSCKIKSIFALTSSPMAITWDSVLTNFKQANDSIFVNGYVPNSYLYVSFQAHTKPDQDSSGTIVSFYKNSILYCTVTQQGLKGKDNYPSYETLMPIVGTDTLKIVMSTYTDSILTLTDTVHSGTLTLIRFP